MKRITILTLALVIGLVACKLEPDDDIEFVEKVDESEPQLLASTPENRQLNVDAKTSIHLYFDEPLSQEIPNSSIQILDQETN